LRRRSRRSGVVAIVQLEAIAGKANGIDFRACLDPAGAAASRRLPAPGKLLLLFERVPIIRFGSEYPLVCRFLLLFGERGYQFAAEGRDVGDHAAPDREKRS
jgi:hypothetical protein